MRAMVLGLLLLLVATGCVSRTAYGDCVGIVEDRDPALKYNLSVLNVTLAVIFVEMIIPPIVVLADETLCPVGRK